MLPETGLPAGEGAPGLSPIPVHVEVLLAVLKYQPDVVFLKDYVNVANNLF